jgi:hypothetical protein
MTDRKLPRPPGSKRSQRESGADHDGYFDGPDLDDFGWTEELLALARIT